ncbi:MAG: hypothetical protein Q7U79_13000 [Rhodoferax sp.]|nr:hypothetical protein [Rhodoferax sp.]
MNCLTTAWTSHGPELRGWLFEVARKTLADRLCLKQRMTQVCQVRMDDAGPPALVPAHI